MNSRRLEQRLPESLAKTFCHQTIMLCMNMSNIKCEVSYIKNKQVIVVRKKTEREQVVSLPIRLSTNHVLTYIFKMKLNAYHKYCFKQTI